MNDTGTTTMLCVQLPEKRYRIALRQAALDGDTSMRALINTMVLEWLTAHGYLSQTDRTRAGGSASQPTTEDVREDAYASAQR